MEVTSENNHNCTTLWNNNPTTQRFRDLCKRLEIDPIISEDSWIDFERVNGLYTLQGDIWGWFGVSLYISWRNGIRTNSNSKIDLIAVLKETNLTLQEFFQKSKKWIIMSKPLDTTSQHLEEITREFSLLYIIMERYFEKFFKIFNFLEDFKMIDTTFNKRKPRRRQCNVNEIFHFGWILFISAKAFCYKRCQSLMSCIHVMLCVLQFIFENVYTNENIKIKLLSPLFSDFKESTNPGIPDVVSLLYHNESKEFFSESKNIRTTVWEEFLAFLVDSDVLKLDKKRRLRLFEPENFSHSLHNIDQHYMKVMEGSHKLDERHFLLCVYNTQDFNPLPRINPNKLSQQSKNTLNIDKSPSDASMSTNYSQTNFAKNKLYLTRALVLSCLSHTDVVTNLEEFFEQNKIDKKDKLFKLASEYENKILENSSGFLPDYLNISTVLFYRLFVSVMRYELKRSESSLKKLLDHDPFYKLIYTCSFEIISFAFKNEIKFPQTLSVMEIEPCLFFTIIEIVIRAESYLSRATVKHLNTIEESIVNIHAWKTGSPLLDEIKQNGFKVPSFDEVAQSYGSKANYIVTPERSFPTISLLRQMPVSSFSRTPSSSPAVSSLRIFDISERKRTFASVSRNLFGRIDGCKESKMTLVSNSKSRTSTDSPICGSDLVSKSPKPFCPPRLMSSVPQSPKKMPSSPKLKYALTPVVIKNLQSKNLREAQTPVSSSVPPLGLREQPDVLKPTLSPLIYFMRKFYHLASSRLSNLCVYLNMKEEYKSRCWMCLEHAITNHVYLLKNHCLDQMIMCSVYAMGRALNENWTFNIILSWYRMQEYADNNVYRNALIDSGGEEEAALPENMNSTETPECEMKKYETGDLIKYYNEVFVRKLQSYVLRFSQTHKNGSLTLSPLPRIRSFDYFSSLKVSPNLSVFVSPKKNGGSSTLRTSSTSSLYCYEHSPTKILQDINLKVRSSCNTPQKTPIGALRNPTVFVSPCTPKHLFTIVNRSIQSSPLVSKPVESLNGSSNIDK